MADEATATANEIEREMMAWRGASGGVHAIRACAIAVARKMDARFSAALATPPASPSPAPAAVDVEDLVARLREVRYLNLTSIDPITKSQLDTVGKLMGEAATALSTLAADKARIEAERDDARELVDAINGTEDEFREAVERAGYVGSAYIVHVLDECVARAEAAEARASALEAALVKIERLGSDGEHSGDRHAQCRAIAQSALAASQGER